MTRQERTLITSTAILRLESIERDLLRTITEGPHSIALTNAAKSIAEARQSLDYFRRFNRALEN